MAADIMMTYDAKHHPKYVSGEWTEDQLEGSTGEERGGERERGGPRTRSSGISWRCSRRGMKVTR